MDIEHPEFLNFLRCAQKNKLRYLCIGGYAVNYYGFHRMTEDLDIWIAPTNKNKECFFNTMLCMGYTESEFDDIKNEDFTTHFMCTLGARPNVIDVLTILHHLLNFDEAEKKMSLHNLNDGIELRLVSYEELKATKLYSRRPKDTWDITQLERLRNM
ncbi:MAG: hypothetical protein ABI707_14920 [Ferruginibacter sp.]